MSEWNVCEEQMTRLFVFEGFREAMAFMAKVAEIAEEMNHHPEWRNVYNKVWVTLTTHDEGRVTPIDWELATAIDRVALGLSLK